MTQLIKWLTSTAHSSGAQDKLSFKLILEQEIRVGCVADAIKD